MPRPRRGGFRGPRPFCCRGRRRSPGRARAGAWRDALLLAGSGDYSYEQIAAMLGIPLGTVKWRISEARKVLKQKLAAKGFSHVG